MKRVISFAILLASLSATAADGPADIERRASVALSKFQTLNRLGLDCDARLQVEGLPSWDSDACAKYRRNITGEYFQALKSECLALSDWYESTRASIQSGIVGPDSPDAAAIVRAMRGVQAACHPDSMAEHRYLTAPMDTVDALKSLE